VLPGDLHEPLPIYVYYTLKYLLYVQKMNTPATEGNTTQFFLYKPIYIRILAYSYNALGQTTQVA
jgi:hypothetical protein